MSTQDAQERRNAGGSSIEPVPKFPRRGEATELTPSMGSSHQDGSHRSLQVTPRDPDHQNPSLYMNHRTEVYAPQQTVVQNVLHVHESPSTGSPSKAEVKELNAYLHQQNVMQHSELIQTIQQLETVTKMNEEGAAQMIACKEKYERGAAEFQSGWVTARAEMEDASAVNAGKAKAEADRRLHETRASSAQSIARLTARLEEANATTVKLKSTMPDLQAELERKTQILRQEAAEEMSILHSKFVEQENNMQAQMSNEYSSMQRTIDIWRERHHEAVIEQNAQEEAMATMSAQMNQESIVCAGVKMTHEQIATHDTAQWQRRLLSQENEAAKLSLMVTHETKMSEVLSEQLSELKAGDSSQAHQRLIEEESRAAKLWHENQELKANIESELLTHHNEIHSLKGDICALQDENTELLGKNFIIHSGDEAQGDEEWSDETTAPQPAAAPE